MTISTLASCRLRVGNADGDSRINGLSARRHLPLHDLSAISLFGEDRTEVRQIEHLLFLRSIVETRRLEA